MLVEYILLLCPARFGVGARYEATLSSEKEGVVENQHNKRANPNSYVLPTATTKLSTETGLQWLSLLSTSSELRDTSRFLSTMERASNINLQR